MKDTLNKLRNLVSMKTVLLDAIQEDLAKATAKIILLEDRVAELETESSWWKAMDNDLASRENDERSDEITLEMVIKAPDFDLEQ